MMKVFVLVLLGVSHALSSSSMTDVQPRGVHLALTTSSPSSSMEVSFFTLAVGGKPTVEILSPVSRKIEGTTKDLIRYHHDIYVDDLEPDTMYKYRVFVDPDVPSKTFSFETLSKNIESFKVGIVGDMGVNNSAHTIQRLSSLMSSYAFVQHVGDVGYADDFDLPLHIEPSTGLTYQGVYDLFQETLAENLTSFKPYMVTPGNHDVSCHVTGDHGCPKEERNFSQFNARYKMPSYPHDHNLWYSFDIGSVHFVSIDTESDFKDAPTTPHTWIGGGKGGGFGDQLTWFREDLAQARNSSDFIVVFGHRPWYSTDGKWNDWPIRAPVHLQAAFEPLFHEFGVDLYICGHKHYYERAKRAYKDKPDPSGTIQIISGAAGNNEDIQKGKGNVDLIVASNYETQGFGELEYDAKTDSLTWNYILSNTGEIVDTITVDIRKKV